MLHCRTLLRAVDANSGGNETMAEDDLLRLIEKIYSSAQDPNRWHDLTVSLAARFHGSAVLFVQDLKTAGAGFVDFAGVDPRFVQAYVEHYAAINPTREMWIDAPAGTVIEGTRDLDY